MLIKYEDLIKDKKNIFLKILEFINKFKKKKISISVEKIENILNTTSFEQMKNLEKEKGFFEAMSNKVSGKKKPFFNLGPENNWEKLLEDNIRLKIESAFQAEMKELGYL